METGKAANRVKCPFNIPIIEQRGRERALVAPNEAEWNGTWKLHNKEAKASRPRLRRATASKMPTCHCQLAVLPACLTRNKFPNRNIMYSVALAAFLIQCGREASAAIPPPPPPPPKPSDRVKRSEKMTCAPAQNRNYNFLCKILDGSVI